MDFDVKTAFLVIFSCISSGVRVSNLARGMTRLLKIKTSHDPMILVDVSPHAYRILGGVNCTALMV